MKDLYNSFIIQTLLRDLCVDDLVSSFNDENLYKFYQGACKILMQGGFQLRKWITNFKNLQKHINENSCERSSKNYVKKVL